MSDEDKKIIVRDNNKDLIVARALAMHEKLWAGDYPLWQTFWLFHVVGCGVLKTISQYFYGNVSAIFALAALLWAGYTILPIWRAAGKYKGSSLFALSAKIAAIFIGAGFLFTIT